MKGILARLRRRSFALGAALAVVTGIAIPVVSTALPAQAINCTFGDNFYVFASSYTSDDMTLNTGNGYLYDATGNLLPEYCQVDTHWGGGYYEWVRKGTSNCITLNASNNYEVHELTCAGLAAQEIKLADGKGNEVWGQVHFAYTDTYNHDLFDNGNFGTVLYGGITWSDGDNGYRWALDGPYR